MYAPTYSVLEDPEERVGARLCVTADVVSFVGDESESPPLTVTDLTNSEQVGKINKLYNNCNFTVAYIK